MICCSNRRCLNGQWFHFRCVNVEAEVEDDWWCSVECEATGASIFCDCKTVIGNL